MVALETAHGSAIDRARPGTTGWDNSGPIVQWQPPAFQPNHPPPPARRCRPTDPGPRRPCPWLNACIASSASATGTGTPLSGNAPGGRPNSSRRPWCNFWPPMIPPPVHQRRGDAAPSPCWRTPRPGYGPRSAILAALPTVADHRPPCRQLQPVAPTAPAHVIKAVMDEEQAPTGGGHRAGWAGCCCGHGAAARDPRPAPARRPSGG